MATENNGLILLTFCRVFLATCAAKCGRCSVEQPMIPSYMRHTDYSSQRYSISCRYSVFNISVSPRQRCNISVEKVFSPVLIPLISSFSPSLPSPSSVPSPQLSPSSSFSSSTLPSHPLPLFLSLISSLLTLSPFFAHSHHPPMYALHRTLHLRM